MEPKNLNEVPDTEFISPGTYTALIGNEFPEGVSTNKGTPYFVVELTTEAGSKIKDTFYDTKNALWRWKILGRACGLTQEQLDTFTPEMCAGKTVEIDVEYEDPNAEQKYCKVSAYRQTGLILEAPQVQKDDVPF